MILQWILQNYIALYDLKWRLMIHIAYFNLICVIWFNVASYAFILFYIASHKIILGLMISHCAILFNSRVTLYCLI